MSSACYTCHGNVVTPNGTIKDLTLHINGNVEYDTSAVDAGAGGTGGPGASGGTAATGEGGSS